MLLYINVLIAFYESSLVVNVRMLCELIVFCGLWQWNNSQTGWDESSLFSRWFWVFTVRWVQVGSLLLIYETVVE